MGKEQMTAITSNSKFSRSPASPIPPTAVGGSFSCSLRRERDIHRIRPTAVGGRVKAQPTRETRDTPRIPQTAVCASVKVQPTREAPDTLGIPQTAVCGSLRSDLTHIVALSIISPDKLHLGKRVIQVTASPT